MNETVLENGWGIIANRFGKPCYSGNPDVGQFDIFASISGKVSLRNRLFKIDSNQSPSYKMPEMTIKSFHVVFTKNRCCHCIYE